MTEIKRKIHVIGINSFEFQELPMKLQNLLGIPFSIKLAEEESELEQILSFLQQQIDISYDLSKCETVLINSNFNCGFYLNRDKLLDILKYKYKIDCIFDACQYPGIQCKYNITPWVKWVWIGL